MTIALMDPARDQAAFSRYSTWIERWIPGVQIRRLSFQDAQHWLHGCAGLVLSGGGDIHPRFYNDDGALEYVREVKEPRDEFEFRTIKEALKERIPVLGICRGAQIFNVAMGGTLIPDIEREGFPSHKKTENGDRIHQVIVSENSLMKSIVGRSEGEVNSSHHQAVANPGNGLKVSVRAADGVIEGLEWEEPVGRPFLLLLQWHPERMDSIESPFAKNIILRFAEEAHQYSQKKTENTNVSFR